MPDTRTIKRYGNRRLYDTASGGYLTNQDVVDIIRQGEDVRVVDSRTGEDVTKSVLINIILEEEKLRQNLLPVSFLLQLIRLQGETLQDFFQNYLTASLEAYLKTRQEFDRRFREWLSLGTGLSGFADPDAEAASLSPTPPAARLSAKRQPKGTATGRSKRQSKRQTERKTPRSAS